MSSVGSKIQFKTKVEAYCYRISKMFPKLIEKNENLCYDTYSLARGVEKAAIEDGHWNTEDFVEDAETLKVQTFAFKDSMQNIINNLHLANGDLLKQVDESIAKSLRLLNIKPDVPEVDQLTVVLVNRRAEGSVQYFKNMLKFTALMMLFNNKQEVIAIRKKYEEASSRSNSSSSNIVWDNFQIAMQKDLELTNSIKQTEYKIDEYKAKIRGLEGYATGPQAINIGSIINSDKIIAIKKQKAAAFMTIDVLIQARVVLNNEYPVTRLVKGEDGVGLTKENSLNMIVDACSDALLVFKDMEKSITSGDMPIERMDFIVNKALESEKITANSTDKYSLEVKEWLKSIETKKFWLNIMNIAVPLGLALACFIPGIGVGAIIALSTIGAAAGGTLAAFELERAADLNLAANASEAGSENFVNIEEARAAYVWAIVGMALSVFDAFLAGRAIKSLIVVNKGLRGVQGSAKILKLLDERTLSKLAKLDADEMVKLVNIRPDAKDTANIIKGINKVEDLKAITKFDLSKLSSTEIKTIISNPQFSNILKRINPESLGKFSSSGAGLKVINNIENIDEALKFIDRIEGVANGPKLLVKLEKATGNSSKKMVQFFNTLDDDVVETGLIVANKFDNPDTFISTLGDIKKTYYSGTTKVSNVPRNISRSVYQRSDIDWDKIVTRGKTNLDLALEGKPPIGIDGKKIQLHHFTQEEPGTMIEILTTKHTKYDEQLHGLIPDGSSFRRNDILDKQYNNFRDKYWKWRAQEVLANRSR